MFFWIPDVLQRDWPYFHSGSLIKRFVGDFQTSVDAAIHLCVMFRDPCRVELLSDLEQLAPEQSPGPAHQPDIVEWGSCLHFPGGCIYIYIEFIRPGTEARSRRPGRTVGRRHRSGFDLGHPASFRSRIRKGHTRISKYDSSRMFTGGNGASIWNQLDNQ